MTRFELLKSQKKLVALRAQQSTEQAKVKLEEGILKGKHIKEGVNTIIFKAKVFISAQRPKAEWISMNPSTYKKQLPD